MEFFRFPSPVLTPPTTGSIWEETDADLVINCGCYRSLRARHAATTIIRYAIAGEAASTELGSRTNVEGARNVTSTKITAFSHLGHRTYRAGNRNIDAWMRSSHILMLGWIQVRKNRPTFDLWNQKILYASTLCWRGTTKYFEINIWQVLAYGELLMRHFVASPCVVNRSSHNTLLSHWSQIPEAKSP